MIFFCVSLCLRLVFIVCMYYVTVIALSYHVSVVMCFVHIMIIIIIIITGTTMNRPLQARSTDGKVKYTQRLHLFAKA